MTDSDEKDRAQAELAGASDLAVAIGPLLASSIQQTLVSWAKKVPVHTLLPWLQDQQAHHPPSKKACLCIGRAESFRLKGLDLASAAIARLSGKPILYVRGVPLDDAESLCKRVEESAKGRLDFRPQKYTVSQKELDASFHRATAVLMPSRTEGFGLVGLEAIARGIPFLASDGSGLAEILLKHGGELGLLSVVNFGNSDEENIDGLYGRLAPIWEAPEIAFKNAHQLAELLRPHLSEAKSITAFVKALRSLRG
jgi:glycosyltransferase involved in cell wall biosynthesis